MYFPLTFPFCHSPSSALPISLPSSQAATTATWPSSLSLAPPLGLFRLRRKILSLEELAMSSSTAACFNKECRDAKSEKRRKGWRLRNGEHAELCDRCSSAFEEGKFCDTFHPHVAGWRSCESCGKPVHCGCIVSAHTFDLLDAGGVNCIDCTRKKSILTQDTGCRSAQWSYLSFSDLLNLNQNLIPGNGSVGSLRQAAHGLTSSAQTKLQPPRSYSGFNHEGKHNFSMRSGIPVIVKDQSPVSHYGLASTSCSETENQTRGSINQQMFIHLTGNPLSSTLKNGLDSSGTIHRNAEGRADISSQNQLFSWCCPKISDRELLHISGGSNSAITPLFEKMLSASDAGRVGRLVLPKKCAETYFPPISEPEGLPLRIQDVKGQDWTFQFRFWPNNNSRMYVLEGITPCIQSMKLHAGDIVTFSRVEPEGKLIMGYRKSTSIPICNQVERSDPDSLQSKVEKPGYVVKDTLGTKTSSSKRRNGIVGSKIKRMKLDNISLIELKVTLEQAQGLLTPHIDQIPKVVLVEDIEFEEFEVAPVIGRPTIFTKASVGEDVQWAQCESCCKWRRIPPYLRLPSGWTCSDNSWDPERSSCIATQELSTEQLEDVLNTMRSANCKKSKAIKPDPDPDEASDDSPAATMTRDSITSSTTKEELSIEQLEHLLSSKLAAELAIHGEGEIVSTSAQATTSKHPRHRPGCSCIVCNQPPSGKGPKHIPTCICNVCATIRRRFQTMMLRREKKKSVKEPETVRQPDPTTLKTVIIESSNNAPNKKLSTSPARGDFDLNIQPEREEELSSPTNLTDKFNDATEETKITKMMLNEVVNLGEDEIESCNIPTITQNPIIVEKNGTMDQPAMLLPSKDSSTSITDK